MNKNRLVTVYCQAMQFQKINKLFIKTTVCQNGGLKQLFMNQDHKPGNFGLMWGLKHDSPGDLKRRDPKSLVYA